MLDDPKKVRESRIRQRDKEERLAAFTRNIMASPQGRAWVNNLLEQFQVLQTPFASDPLTMAHNVGMQNFGRKLMGDLMQLCPDEFITMLKEEADGRRSNGNPGRPDLFGDDNDSGTDD